MVKNGIFESKIEIMNYILFDGSVRDALLPFTYTRPVAEIRVGILTIKEKWEKYLGTTVTMLTEEYLEEKYPMVELDENVFIDASVLPTTKLVESIEFLSENELLMSGEDVVAFYAKDSQEEVDFDSYEVISFEDELYRIENVYDIFLKNEWAIKEDFRLLTEDRVSSEISKTNNVIAPENIFIEEGAVVEFATLNASAGPIYIAKDALIMEGVLIRGPFSLGEKAVVKMGARIYGGTTVGPKCTVAGEVKNSVLFGNSNKGHDGYLGNSVIGEWCNFGADTNCSNMKNTHSSVQLWNYEESSLKDTALQYCGLFMGDHSKTGINTMFNTGTVVGISANVFGGGFPQKFIPSFSWGIEKPQTYAIKKAIETAKRMYASKKEEFSLVDEKVLETVFEQTAINRS